MAKVYGIARPQAVWAVIWDGSNLEEVQSAFASWPPEMFFVNEENDNLCYGNSLEYAAQFPVGSLVTLLGGVAGVSTEEWDLWYSTVDTDVQLKYDVTEDAETLTSFMSKRS